MTVHPLTRMVAKLMLWADLDKADQEALLALPHAVRSMRSQEFIVREDDCPTHCCVLLSGYAFRHKVAGNGGRQIFSIHMKGDIVDLHNSLLRYADHNIQAMTAVKVAMIPIEAIRNIVARFPAVGRAMWYETLVDAAIFREWTLNVGRRDAQTRTAHMLCEFAIRLQVAGLGEESTFELPMTQEQLGDALALSVVHINRTLKRLADDGLIERSKRSVRILEFQQLARRGDFDSKYLHLQRHAEKYPSIPMS